MALIFQPFARTSQLFNSATLASVSHIFDTFQVYETTRHLSNSNVPLFEGHIKAGNTSDYVASASVTNTMMFWSGSIDQGLFGTYTHDTGSLLQAINSGSAEHYVVASPLSEDHNRGIVSDDSPNTLQGANTVEWDVFPTPTITIMPPSRERDLTRYHKAYSFTRFQPVRIRLFKR